MEEKFKAKEEGKFKNPRQYLEDNRMLISLGKEIRYELRNFDNQLARQFDVTMIITCQCYNIYSIVYILLLYLYSIYHQISFLSSYPYRPCY